MKPEASFFRCRLLDWKDNLSVVACHWQSVQHWQWTSICERESLFTRTLRCEKKHHGAGGDVSPPRHPLHCLRSLFRSFPAATKERSLVRSQKERVVWRRQRQRGAATSSQFCGSRWGGEPRRSDWRHPAGEMFLFHFKILCFLFVYFLLPDVKPV